DMYYFESAAADETAKAGMRAVLGQVVLDFPAPDNKTWAQAIAATEAYLQKWKGHRLVSPALAPPAPYQRSPGHLREARALAHRYDAPVVIHVAETREEMKTIGEKYGKTPVALLEDLGVLDERVVAAHCIWVDPTDTSTLARRHVGVAHCPQSNM